MPYVPHTAIHGETRTTRKDRRRRKLQRRPYIDDAISLTRNLPVLASARAEVMPSGIEVAEELLHAPGELVAFLKAENSTTFRITNDEPGLPRGTGEPDPSIVFLVQEGRIARTPAEFSRHLGMPVDIFLMEVRRASQNLATLGRRVTRLGGAF